MIAVLDASAAVRMFVDIDPAIEPTMENTGTILAPDLFIAEVCNAFRKYAKARAITYSDAAAHTERAIGLIDRTCPLEELLSDVLLLTSQTDISTYDLFYVALARRNNATLITADLALRRGAAKLGIETLPVSA